jgi:hypothetical protein
VGDFSPSASQKRPQSGDLVLLVFVSLKLACEFVTIEAPQMDLPFSIGLPISDNGDLSF